MSDKRRCAALLGFLISASSSASELSYTFIDFEVLDTTVETVAVQNPVPNQTVSLNLREGDGIGVAGALALGRRFYLQGGYESSIIDVDGVVQSPLATAPVSGTFDLVATSFGVGFLRPVGQNFDFIAELSFDSVEYDMGSFAGESFDVDDSGAGARLGFRWNPRPTFELFSAVRHTPLGAVDWSTKTFESDTLFGLGMRWYFFEDLAAGFDYEAGDLDTLTISMRFSFGDLQF